MVDVHSQPGHGGGNRQNGTVKNLTLVNDPTNVVQVRQPPQHTQHDLLDDINVDGSDLLVNPIQRSLVHNTMQMQMLGSEMNAP